MSKIKISVQLPIKKLLHNQNHRKWIDRVRTFCDHSGGLRNLMSIASLNDNNFELRLRNKFE